jgi:hypothetical protein
MGTAIAVKRNLVYLMTGMQVILYLTQVAAQTLQTTYDLYAAHVINQWALKI